MSGENGQSSGPVPTTTRGTKTPFRTRKCVYLNGLTMNVSTHPQTGVLRCLFACDERSLGSFRVEISQVSQKSSTISSRSPGPYRGSSSPLSSSVRAPRAGPFTNQLHCSNIPRASPTQVQFVPSGSQLRASLCKGDVELDPNLTEPMHLLRCPSYYLLTHCHSLDETKHE